MDLMGIRLEKGYEAEIHSENTGTLHFMP